MEEFQCLGDRCPSTCCAGWRISVDLKTREKWESVADSVVRSKLLSAIRIIPTDSSNREESSQEFAIKLSGSGLCSLVETSGLCSVHSTMGESYLPRVCDSFPRIYSSVDAQIQLAGNFGCPEAARLALSSHDSMLLLPSVEANLTRELEINPVRIQRVADQQTDLYLSELRAIARHLIENPETSATSAWAMVSVLVGLSTKEANEKGIAKAAEIISPMFYAVRNDVGCAQRCDGLESEVVNDEFLCRVFDIVFWVCELLRNNSKPLPSAQCLSEAIRVFPRSEELNADAIRLFRDATNGGFDRFDRRQPFVLKNLLLNDLLTGGFFTCSLEQMNEQVFAANLRLHVRRIFLVGVFIQSQEDFSIEKCIPVVQAISRYVEHNPVFAYTDLFVDGKRVPA
jgi:lysine-N-methylase